MKKLLYISDCYVNSSVFESQVHTICNEHSSSFDVTLLALCNASEINKESLLNTKYKLVKYKKPPKLFVNYMQKIAMLTFSDIQLFESTDVIHCRGHIGSAFAINVCKKYNIHKSIIADIRGAVPEEIMLTNSNGAKIAAYFARKLEEFVFKNSDYFFFVSKNMGNFYYEKYQYNREKYDIFPTIVNEKYFYKSKLIRDEMRSKLQIDDKKVYIYVGGVHKLQNIDKILIAFEKESRKNDDLYLIMLVTQIDVVEKLLSNLNLPIKNILIHSTSYSDVGKYLNAADFGLIIREKNIVNYVASPTKVNEYLACNVKVIDNIDDIGDLEYTKDTSIYMPMENIISGQKKIYNTLLKGEFS